MEKVEIVLKKLSNLYEFNRNIQTYKIHLSTKIKDQVGIVSENNKLGGQGKSVTLMKNNLEN